MCTSNVFHIDLKRVVYTYTWSQLYLNSFFPQVLKRYFPLRLPNAPPVCFTQPKTVFLRLLQQLRRCSKYVPVHTHTHIHIKQRLVFTAAASCYLIVVVVVLIIFLVIRVSVSPVVGSTPLSLSLSLSLSFSLSLSSFL